MEAHNMCVHVREHICVYVCVVRMCVLVCAYVCVYMCMCIASYKLFKVVEHFIMLQLAFVGGYWKHQY